MWTFLLLILCALSALGQKKPLTLEALHEWRVRTGANAPGPSVWSPDGKYFLYKQANKLMIYDVAAKQEHEAVSLDMLDAAAVAVPKNDRYAWENRHLDEQPLQWNPAGTEVLYASNGDLFLIELNTHTKRGGVKTRQLTKTPVAERDPKFSPDGKQVAFLRDWDLYTLQISSRKETRLTFGGSETLRNGAPDWVYPEELELGSAYWWSPDSQSIAYLQFDTSVEPQYPHEDLLGARAVFEPQRYPQAGENNPKLRLGVTAAAGGETKWLEIGDTVNASLIARAGWTPDSQSVWAVRTNRVQNHLEFLLFDRTAGRPRVVYKEDDPYWINISDSPLFLKNGTEFLWTSERDGWRQVYRYSLNDSSHDVLKGAPPKQLTKGQGMEASLVCADDHVAFFVSSSFDAGSAPGRQLYRVNLDGGTVEAITKEPGTHSVSMAPGCEHFLDRYSSLTSPPETTLRSSDGKERTLLRPADRRVLEEFDLQPTEIVHFPAADGTTLYGRLIKPAGFDPARKYPVIVDVYGGPQAQSVRDSWVGAGMDQVFAARGFVVFEVDNRGTSGRGHAFETPVFHNLGIVELEDQISGVNYIISRGFVDRERLGVNGWSYGGFMTLNMLLNAPQVFHAGFAGAPVTNWLNYDTIYTERYMGLPSQNAEGYAATSLISKAHNLQGKLMIAHNFEDDNVLFQNSLQMIQALEAAGKQFELALYPQKTHGVNGAERNQMEAAMLDFFVRNLHPGGQ